MNWYGQVRHSRRFVPVSGERETYDSVSDKSSFPRDLKEIKDTVSEFEHCGQNSSILAGVLNDAPAYMIYLWGSSRKKI